MKAVILAGGFGTRLGEETSRKPKPMVKIGDQPILWHIMKLFSTHGIKSFIICTGYKGHVIREYFSNLAVNSSAVIFEIGENKTVIRQLKMEPWQVTVIDTGEETMTGGRIKRVGSIIGNEPFCLAYGDQVADLNITELIEYHKKQKTLVTLTAVQPPKRFGVFYLKQGESLIHKFTEKPLREGTDEWVNGGFFVVDPDAIEYIKDDSTQWEREPLENLASTGQLTAYRHPGFWQSMETLRDKKVLEQMWLSREAPWRVW